MLSPECLGELRSAWLPHMTDAGLDRLTELLEKGSPLLIHGCFTRAVPMGCLASHVAWHHPRTAHLTADAGITWLYHVAGLNPATSAVILATRIFMNYYTVEILFGVKNHFGKSTEEVIGEITRILRHGMLRA